MKHMFSGERPAHERPEDVFGEWQNIPRAEWEFRHYLAEYTAGVATTAMGYTVGGAALTISGIDDICEGLEHKSLAQFAKGSAKMITGRGLDLADGARATKDQVRSKTGALADSAFDKVVTAYALKRFLDAEIITTSEAVWIALEQGVIAAESVAIKRLGGEPNPSFTGKGAMFSLWSFFTARVTERAAARWEKPRLETAAYFVGTASKVAAHALTAVAIADYSKDVLRCARNN